jgi:hypothetical protein
MAKTQTATPKTQVHPYLRNKIVHVVPAPSKGKWRGLIAPEQEASLNDMAFMVPGAMRNYIKRLGSGQILDTITKNTCVDFNGEELTEKEYFEKILRLNLDVYSPDNDWDNNYHYANGTGYPKYTYISLNDGELTLDLNKPEDMLKYKILLTWPDEIARSQEVYKAENRPSVLFIIQDEKDEDVNLMQEAEDKAKAATSFFEFKDNKDKMLEVLNSVGISIAYKTSLDGIRQEFAKLYTKTPAEFTKALKDPKSSLKYTIKLAREFGIITSATGSGKFMTLSGKACTLDELVEYFRLAPNFAELQDIENKVFGHKENL